MPGMNIQKKPGMFGNGGAGRAIAGMIGDFLLQRAGMQPVYQPTMLEKWKQAQELAHYDRQRADTNADWKNHFDYTQANSPDDMSSHMIAAGIDPHSPQGKALYAASLDPVVMTPQGPMTRSQLLGASAGQPAPANVTFTPIDPTNGGPTPGGSGGFPGY